MWDIKLKATNQWTKQKLTNADDCMVVSRGEGGQGEVEEGKEAPTDGSLTLGVKYTV